MLQRFFGVLVVSFFLVLVNTTSALADTASQTDQPVQFVYINGERVSDEVEPIKIRPLIQEHAAQVRPNEARSSRDKHSTPFPI